MAIFLPTTVATPGDFSIKACDSCYLMSAEICVEDGNKRSYEVKSLQKRKKNARLGIKPTSHERKALLLHHSDDGSGNNRLVHKKTQQATLIG